MSGGYRSRSSWKYRVIKKLRHRAETFRDESTNEADRRAWILVIGWLKTFRERHGIVNSKGAIGITGEDVDL